MASERCKVVIIHPEIPTVRRVFDMSSEQAAIIRSSPFKICSTQEGAVIKVTAIGDKEYHEMIRWIEDYRGRERA